MFRKYKIFFNNYKVSREMKTANVTRVPCTWIVGNWYLVKSFLHYKLFNRLWYMHVPALFTSGYAQNVNILAIVEKHQRCITCLSTIVARNNASQSFSTDCMNDHHIFLNCQSILTPDSNNFIHFQITEYLYFYC